MKILRQYGGLTVLLEAEAGGAGIDITELLQRLQDRGLVPEAAVITNFKVNSSGPGIWRWIINWRTE